MEKSVCLDKTVARILNCYIGNVSGRQGFRPLRDIEETFVFSRRDTACRVRSDNQMQPIISTLSLQSNFSVGDGFPDVPFTKIAMQFLCGHGTPCPYDNVAVISTLNYRL